MLFYAKFYTSPKIYDFYAKHIIGVNLKEGSERKANAIKLWLLLVSLKQGKLTRPLKIPKTCMKHSIS